MKAQTLSKKYIKAVISEIVNIKKYATEKEKNRLIYSELDPIYSDTCMYGLMTGDCYSLRASTLINKCVNFGINNKDVRSGMGVFNFILIKVKRFFKAGYGRNYYTPLENFIALVGCKKYTRNILKFIKGEIKTLQIRELLT